MKITGVTCDYLTLGLTIPVRETEREYGIVLVTIETDAGHRGVGLARHYDEQGLAIRQVVLNDLVPLLERLGDVVTPGHLWHEAMFELPGTFYRHPTGVLNTALSAVDQALWDVRGQVLGEPVYKLLGGAQDEIEVYVTFGFNIYTPEEEAEAAKRAQAQGFRAFKLQGVDDRGGNVSLAAARVRRLRETVGEDAQIILDAHNNYSVYEAIELARLVRRYEVAYIDEPVHARDPAAMRRLRDAATGVRFAGRSRGGSLIDNRDLVDSGGLDLLGPERHRPGRVHPGRQGGRARGGAADAHGDRRSLAPAERAPDRRGDQRLDDRVSPPGRGPRQRDLHRPGAASRRPVAHEPAARPRIGPQ